MKRALGVILIAILGAVPLTGAILTVGLHGTYPTIQQAIDAAVVGADTEIRVEGDRSYQGGVLVPSSFSSGSIEVTGGWDATFLVRDPDPDGTFIDGADITRSLDVRMTGGTFTLDGFTLRNGVAFGNGGGVRVWPGGDSVVTLRNSRISGNLATDTVSIVGGGIYAELDGGEQLIIEDVRIRSNWVENTGSTQALGGGIGVYLTGSARIRIEDSEIDSNTISSDGGAVMGGGVYLAAHQNSVTELISTHPFANTASSSNIFASGVNLRSTGSASITLERCGIALNDSVGSSAPQFRSVQEDASTLILRDSGVAGSDGAGLVVFGFSSSQIHLINLTVADNATTGIRTEQSDSATITLYNSISYGNGTDLGSVGTLDSGFNLIDVDPLFVDPSILDYHLRVGSPAENAGTPSPPGGLGSVDFDGNARVQDGVVDIGMYEGIAEIFSDGFESGDTGAWSSTGP